MATTAFDWLDLLSLEDTDTEVAAAPLPPAPEPATPVASHAGGRALAATTPRRRRNPAPRSS